MEKPRDETQELVNAIEKLWKEARSNERFKTTSITMDQLDRMKAQVHVVQTFVWEHTDGPPLVK